MLPLKSRGSYALNGSAREASKEVPVIDRGHPVPSTTSVLFGRLKKMDVDHRNIGHTTVAPDSRAA